MSIERLLTAGRRGFTRQIAAIALVLADGTVERAWGLAERDPEVLLAVLRAVPQLPELSQRSALHERLFRIARGQLPRTVADRLKRRAQRLQKRFGGPPAIVLRRAAFDALVTTGREPEQVFRFLASVTDDPQLRETAYRALSRIPSAYWPRDEVRRLLEKIVSTLSAMPPKRRTRPDARAALELGYQLAAVLPGREASDYRKKLSDLGVRVIVIRPVPHMLLYDKREIFVEAGKPVEIVFQNTDVMPHNLIIGRPGSLLTIGRASDDLAVDPRGFERGFVPRLKEVMYHTRLLQPGEEDRITFTAPSKPDDYPYVCTFPGHWRRMNGIMHVVEDLDAVPSDRLAGAETPSSPAPPARKFVRDWKLEDLKASLEEVGPNRNLARGRQLFEQLACVKCHQPRAQEQNEIAPPLETIRRRFRSGEIDKLYVLRSVVDPSKDVAEEYRTTVILTVQGKLYTGIVKEEKDGKVVLRVNPLDTGRDEPVVLDADQIEERMESRTSLMPQGLVNTATREEILDLLSYVLYGSDGAAEAGGE